MTWNTVYLQAAIEQLLAEGVLVDMDCVEVGDGFGNTNKLRHSK